MKELVPALPLLDEGESQLLGLLMRKVTIEGSHWIWNGTQNSVTGKPIQNRYVTGRRYVQQIHVHRFLFEICLLRPINKELAYRQPIKRICDEELCVHPLHHSLTTWSIVHRERGQS